MHTIQANHLFDTYNFKTKDVKLLDIRKDVNILFTLSGSIEIEIKDFKDTIIAFEWSAYHQNSPHLFLKDTKWRFICGDWHISFINKTIALSGAILLDGSTPLSGDEAVQLAFKAMNENYRWEFNIYEIIENNLV